MVTNKLVEQLLSALVVLAVYFLGYCVLMCALTSGRVDYCYVDNIQGQTGGYEVIGHRSWSRNAHLGVAESPTRANDLMTSSASCPK